MKKLLMTASLLVPHISWAHPGPAHVHAPLPEHHLTLWLAAIAGVALLGALSIYFGKRLAHTEEP